MTEVYKSERFTNPGRLLFQTAQDEAEKQKRMLITPLDIFVALTVVKPTDAYSTLTDFDIVTEKVRPYVASVSTNVPEQNLTSVMLSDDAKKALELAVDSAIRRGHEVLTPAHILIGLLRLENTIIDDLTAHFQVSRKDLIRRVDYYLAQRTPDEYYLPAKENDGCLEALKSRLGIK